MAIITISRGCFSHGQEIAEKVAAMLGYACISREVLIEAGKLFNVSEKKLIKSLHDAPTILERIANGKTEYLADIKAVLLEYVRNGDGDVIQINVNSEAEGPVNYCATYGRYECYTNITPFNGAWGEDNTECELIGEP